VLRWGRLDYHKLDIAGKQALALERMREPAVACPVCDTHVTPRDLVEHMVRRCAGRRAPHPGSTWVGWREALRMVRQSTLAGWVRRGLVRTRGGAGGALDRRYLLRDLAMCLAWLRFQRSARLARPR